jgi:hypothetical protein
MITATQCRKEADYNRIKKHNIQILKVLKGIIKEIKEQTLKGYCSIDSKYYLDLEIALRIKRLLEHRGFKIKIYKTQDNKKGNINISWEEL